MTTPIRYGLALLVAGVLALYISYLLLSGGWGDGIGYGFSAVGSLGLLVGAVVLIYGLLRRP